MKGYHERFKCAHCGKITAGRRPRTQSGEVGDRSFMFPRRHKYAGKPCPGNILEAENVLVKLEADHD